MPTFICEEEYKICIANGENDQAAQNVCTKTRDADCGTLNPANYTAAASSTSSSATATASSTGTATSSTASTSTTAAKAAAASLMIGREYGTGLLAAGVAAIFGFLL